MNTFNERSWMFINYLVHEIVEFMVVHGLALVHELSEFITVHEQPMFMNKVRVHEQNNFMNFHESLICCCIHEPFMNTFFVLEHSWTMNVHEQFMIISPGPDDFESCVWRTVSSNSSHHPQEVLLAKFSLYEHKGGLKPDSFHCHIVYQCSTVYFL